MKKPLGRKAYGSIPHLPGSRLGPGDYSITAGQAKIATLKTRDKHDHVICQEKLDGSCVAIAKLVDSRVVPLTRSGYLAETSPYLQHHIFSDWVYANYDRFDALLQSGEWVSGEWLAQAHGTRYCLMHEPFVAFDLWSNGDRLIYTEFRNRIDDVLVFARPLHFGYESFSVEQAIAKIEYLIGRQTHGAIDPIEGAVWRVERNEKVEFLCKFVYHSKIDGCYLPELNGTGKPIWNGGLEQYLPSKALARLKEMI